ncbi:Bifunctional protein GlmU [Orobanche gracilis]
MRKTPFLFVNLPNRKAQNEITALVLCYLHLEISFAGGNGSEVGSSSSNIWLAQDPSKRWGEIFFLLYTPFWLTLCLGIVVPYKLYEQVWINFTEWEYRVLGLVSALPAFIIPVILVGKCFTQLVDNLPRIAQYVGRIVTGYVGNYFWTHYFYTVLGASYTFPSWKMNNVPHTTFLLTHVWFLFYHVTSNMTLRRIEHSVTHFPENTQYLLKAAWILALSYSIAYLETLAISTFPYYEFVDRASMYKVGSLFYAIYFFVSFPMFLRVFARDRIVIDELRIIRIDENPGDRWDLSRVAVDALGAAMLVTIILDLWRIFLGPVFPIPDPKQCLQPGLPWFPSNA